MQTIAYPKEQMHRIAYTKLTSEQVAAKLAASPGPRSASQLSDAFAGQSLQIVTDKGPTLHYRFASNDRLSVAENDGAAGNSRYAALTLGEVAFFTHLVPGTQRGYHVQPPGARLPLTAHRRRRDGGVASAASRPCGEDE